MLRLDLSTYRGCHYYLRSGRSCRSRPRRGECVCGTHRAKLNRMRTNMSVRHIRRFIEWALDHSDMPNGSCDSRRFYLMQAYLQMVTRSELQRNAALARVVMQKALMMLRNGFPNPHATLKHYFASDWGCMHATLDDAAACARCREVTLLRSRELEQYMPCAVVKICVQFILPSICTQQ